MEKNPIAKDIILDQLNKIHKTKGELKPLFGTTIFKYESPAKDSIIKLLGSDRDV